MVKDFKKYAKLAAQAASDKKAEKVVVIDLRRLSDVSDFVVLANANSTTQLVAIRQEVISRLRDAGLKPSHADGKASGVRWIALDYGGFVMHLMLPEARDFYRLEQMWENPRYVVWEEEPKEKPKKKAKKTTKKAKKK